MLSSPAAGITMEEKAENVPPPPAGGGRHRVIQRVRKHLSRSRGTARPRGASRDRMGAAPVGRPGDDPSVIASGPFSPTRRRMRTRSGSSSGTASITRSLPGASPPCRRRDGALPETPKQDEPRLPRDNLRGSSERTDAMDGAALKLARESEAGPAGDRPPARIPSRRGEGMRPFVLYPVAEGRGGAFAGHAVRDHRRPERRR